MQVWEILPIKAAKEPTSPITNKDGEIIAELLDDDLETSETETSIELNFAVLKFKHTIKKKTKWERFAIARQGLVCSDPESFLQDHNKPKKNPS